MITNRLKEVLVGVLASLALCSLGCQGESETLAITKMEINEEQVAAIRSHDQMVDEEEGGRQKQIQGTRPNKLARKTR